MFLPSLHHGAVFSTLGDGQEGAQSWLCKGAAVGGTSSALLGCFPEEGEVLLSLLKVVSLLLSLIHAASFVPRLVYGIWDGGAECNLFAVRRDSGGKSFLCTPLADSSPTAQQVAGQWESGMLLSSPMAVMCCAIRSWDLPSAVVCQK